MGPKEIANRLTGISTPFLGLQWSPARLDVDVARQVISFLEDRRVLYEPYEAEEPDHCVQSVLQIRAFLTQVLGEAGLGAVPTQHLEAMRAACREFNRQVGVREERDGEQVVIHLPRDRLHRMHFGDFRFNQALGELRRGVGIQLGQLAIAFELDLPDQLAGILPPEPDDELDALPLPPDRIW